MNRIPLFIAFITIAAMSSPIALDAQHGGGGGGRGGGGQMNGGGRGDNSGGHGGGGQMNGGGRGGDGQMNGRGNQFNVRVTHGVPVAPGVSVDHPLPRNLNTVKPAPVLGFGRRPPSPFAVGPGYYNRQHPTYGIAYGAGYGGPGYGDDYGAPPPAVEDDTSLLFLDVAPSTAMAYVDNSFVGSVDDLSAQGLELSPGHHWIDLEAPGYDKKTFELMATPGQPVRYRGTLSPIRPVALAASPAHPPQTMYAIPGCYGGNTPPVAANLPKGCDIANVRVIRPQPAAGGRP